jgi:hypothetical protein
MVGEGGFSIQEIFKMTDNFSPANKIGDGSFSTVYKGRLRDGSFVAVKRAQKVYYDRTRDATSVTLKSVSVFLVRCEYYNKKGKKGKKVNSCLFF